MSIVFEFIKSKGFKSRDILNYFPGTHYFGTFKDVEVIKSYYFNGVK